MNANVAKLVQTVGGLITLPDVFIRINRLVQDPNSSNADVAKVVSQDPSFTVRLLQVANSPLYGFSSKIDNVSKAVSVIGMAQISNLALSTSVAKSFASMPNELVSMENFWKHSLYCSLSAKILARKVRGCDPEALFTAGLLHDIGELLIFSRLPKHAKKALLMVIDNPDEMPVHLAERKTMGFHHGHVGGELARQWNLPLILEECIAHHHDIQEAKHYPKEAALVHIANVLALMAELDTLDLSDVQPIDPLAWEITGLVADEVIEPTVTEVKQEIVEAIKLFLG